MSFASYKDRNALAVALKADSTAVDAEAAEAALAEVEDRDQDADLEAPPGGSDPGTLPERRGRNEIDLSRSISRRLLPLGSGRGWCDSGRP